MALLVDGVPVGGSIGKITYSRNRYGAYSRRRTKPVNPNSIKQNDARSRFRSAVAAWQAQSAVNQLAWNNWAILTPWLNKAGETVHLTGQAAFIRSYTALMLGSGNGMTPPTGVGLTPPSQNDVGSIAVTAPSPAEWGIVVATQTTNLITFGALAGANSSGIATGRFLVEVTPGQNPTRNFPGSRWASLTFDGSGAASYQGWSANTIPIADGVLTLPWAYSVGQRVWFRFRGIGGTDYAERRVTTQVIVGPITIVAGTP